MKIKNNPGGRRKGVEYKQTSSGQKVNTGRPVHYIEQNEEYHYHGTQLVRNDNCGCQEQH